MIRLFIIILLAYSSLVLADSKKGVIPRFVSIKSNEVNVRQGPSIKSTIEWIFVKKNEPVKVTAEYEHWRQIKDVKGDGGWVHSSVLSPRRFVIVQALSELTKNSNGGKILAKIAPELRCEFKKCKDDKCLIKCQELKGWIDKKHLWGI